MKNSAIRFTILAYSILLCLSANAQDALLMQNINFSEFGYNSAFIADDDATFTVALTNTTGGGIQNTGQINFQGFTQLEKSGLAIGTRVESKYYGLFRTSTMQFETAKKVRLNANSHLFAGFGAGMQFNSLRTNELNEFVNRTDPMLVDNAFPQYRFIFGFGLGYNYLNKLKAGFSMPSFARTESDFNPIYLANVSYRIQAGEVIGIRPEALMFGSNVAPISAEFSAKIDFKNQVWIKAGARTTNTLVGAIGVDTRYITIGYAYNGFLQEFSAIVPAIHNINITFRSGSKNPEKRLQLW
ncbi:type IX secretion system membrane protein PorP/SprF [Cryomorpha ignava]|uniref:Type IX secretion system membrane protein PorP/SprF n=1 Tax=Cryomorpha ignava TaxID=101383 RepID=A0A7K3WTD6_9FLAO|nr:type IX secretion system membrane protein PorP/SprF [Cryomorpha ignava]NEN24301.1 type IX secretion system membrane protein PorP/SprF [Cryomorpha ignava]